MAEKDWFVNNCQENGLSSEQITLFGRYAVNGDGDLLVENDEYEFVYITAAEIASSDFDYEMQLEIALGILDDNSTKIYFDLKDLCYAYKEAVLRNKDIDSAKMGLTKESPVHCVYEVSELIHNWNDFDTEHHHTKLIPGFYEDKDYGMGNNLYSENPRCEVTLPRRFEQEEGYRFALKVVNINNFCDLFGFIGLSDQRTPFGMLHDLENKVAENWQERGVVLSTYDIDYLGDKFAQFEFSHFELDDEEPEDKYRCFYACYRYVGTVKI